MIIKIAEELMSLQPKKLNVTSFSVVSAACNTIYMLVCNT